MEDVYRLFGVVRRFASKKREEGPRRTTKRSSKTQTSRAPCDNRRVTEPRCERAFNSLVKYWGSVVLTELHIENFKCFGDEIIVPVGGLNLLTGINAKGKSTTLQALLVVSQSLAG